MEGTIMIALNAMFREKVRDCPKVLSAAEAAKQENTERNFWNYTDKAKWPVYFDS